MFQIESCKSFAPSDGDKKYEKLSELVQEKHSLTVGKLIILSGRMPWNSIRFLLCLLPNNTLLKKFFLNLKKNHTNSNPENMYVSSF